MAEVANRPVENVPQEQLLEEAEASNPEQPVLLSTQDCMGALFVACLCVVLVLPSALGFFRRMFKLGQRRKEEAEEGERALRAVQQRKEENEQRIRELEQATQARKEVMREAAEALPVAPTFSLKDRALASKDRLPEDYVPRQRHKKVDPKRRSQNRAPSGGGGKLMDKRAEIIKEQDSAFFESLIADQDTPAKRQSRVEDFITDLLPIKDPLTSEATCTLQVRLSSGQRTKLTFDADADIRSVIAKLFESCGGLPEEWELATMIPRKVLASSDNILDILEDPGTNESLRSLGLFPSSLVVFHDLSEDKSS